MNKSLILAKYEVMCNKKSYIKLKMTLFQGHLN